MWIRSAAAIIIHIYTRKHSVRVVVRGHRHASPTSRYHVLDDVTALVEQPQSDDVALPFPVAADVVAGLVARRHHHAEVSGQSMDQTSYASLDAVTVVEGDVLCDRSKHKSHLATLRVKLRIPTDDQNLCGVVPEEQSAAI